VSAKFKELPGLEATVDEVIYMPDLDAPSDRPYPFVYFITITNRSKTPVTIRGRKWVVRQDDDEVIVVEGDGVVGQFPRLAPGEEFSYNSRHYVARNSQAEGAFFGESDEGKLYFCRIPRFSMRLPDWV
jgi:ApaG protein